MRKIMVAAVTTLLFFGTVALSRQIDRCRPPSRGPADAVEASVQVQTPDGYFGSGVVFVRGEYTYVWTAAHVVSGLQQVKTVIDTKTGRPRVSVSYKDVKVSTITVENGRKVEETIRHAKILLYSWRHDLSLLKVYKKNAFKAGVTFLKTPPTQGADVWHVGSPAGPLGHTSVAAGVLSAVGRLRLLREHDEAGGIPYDQVALQAAPGSSGGGVFLKSSGECVGLITEALYTIQKTPGLVIIVPSRRLVEFAKANSYAHAVDASVPVPAEAVTTADEMPVPEDWPGRAVPVKVRVELMPGVPTK